jgi:putative transposase
MRALRSAASSFPSVKGVVLQSDQGFQYQSAAYQSLVSQYGIIPSMFRKGNCLDNAPTENFFSHLKEELLRHIHLRDFQEALLIEEDYIHFYNHERIQLKTKLTPMEFRRQFG